MRYEQRYKHTMDEIVRLFLLVPVYPSEVSTGVLAKAIYADSREITDILTVLPSDFPLAERKEKGKTIICFPSVEAKRSALEGYAV